MYILTHRDLSCQETGFLMTHPLLAMSVPELLVPSCSESLRHHGVSQHFSWKLLCLESINIIKYQVTKWCLVWLWSCFDSLLVSCFGGCNMQTTVMSRHGKPGSVHCCVGPCLQPCSSQAIFLGLFKYTSVPVSNRSAAILLEWKTQDSVFQFREPMPICPDYLLTRYISRSLLFDTSVVLFRVFKN